MQEYLFYGRIFTGNARCEVEEAMLVRGREIVYVGEREEAAGLADAGCREVDVGDGVIVPRGGQCLEWGREADFALLSGEPRDPAARELGRYLSGRYIVKK